MATTLAARRSKTEATAARKAAKAEGQGPTKCHCGCGGWTSGPKARFRPGHDAKLLSALLQRVDKGDKEAEADLLRRGWRTETQLVERAAKREAKAETKAEKGAK